jgi:hypothetical protein
MVSLGIPDIQRSNKRGAPNPVGGAAPSIGGLYPVGDEAPLIGGLYPVGDAAPLIGGLYPVGVTGPLKPVEVTGLPKPEGAAP